MEPITTAIATTSIPLFEKLVTDLISPKIGEFAEWCKGKYNEKMIPTPEHFHEYLMRTYDKYSSINALAIPNSQFKLKDIYVTQTLVKRNRFEEKGEEILIDQLPTELIKKYHKILITDTAGMGKSTIMKYMFINLIDNCIKDVGIPIFIELNRLNKNRSILIEIQNELNSLSKEFDNDLLLNLIHKGGFIFFLDGYDEISIADRNEVTKDIQSFISKAGTKNFYVLSSRPEDSLASFGDFQSFNIQPLDKKDAFELLTKYDISKQKKVSKELIKELETGKYKSINEYLVNPLLVSLLYIAFNYKAEIPLKKHQFYRQVYDALFNSHKLAQGQNPHEKRSGLDIDDFNRVLRYVGYECLFKIGVQFDEDTILNSIKKAKLFCRNLNFGESDFLKDLLTSVPLFSKDGTEFKWSHKSLMEYFAARFIAEDTKEKQDTILTNIYNSEKIYKYINMLDIYYDIDYKGFSLNIMLPLLEEFVQYHGELFPLLYNVDKDLLEARIALLFPFCTTGIMRYTFFKEEEKSRDKRERSFFDKNTNKEKWSGTNYGYYDSFVMLGYESQKNSKIQYLLRLLFIKHQELFDQNNLRPKEIDENLYKENMIYRIDVMTGDNDMNHYQLINTLLSETNHLLYQYYLNYKAVIHVIEKIKQETELSQHQLDLFPE